MLILTRRVGETVMIGNDITVTVLGVKGNQVRVGVNAPKEVAVHREEIYERIKREEQAAGGAVEASSDGRRILTIGSSRIREPRSGPVTHSRGPLDAPKPSHLPNPLPERARRQYSCRPSQPARSAAQAPGSADRAPERWPSGRRRTPAKGVWVKSPSRVRIPLSPPI